MTEQELNDFERKNKNDYYALIQLAEDNDLQADVSDIIPSDIIDDLLIGKDWKEIRLLLSCINDLSASHYRLNGLNMLEELFEDDWNYYFKILRKKILGDKK